MFWYRLSRWLSGKESACQGRRHRRCRFSSCVGKIPWRRKMATHSSILAWRIPWTEEPGRLQSMGLKESGTRLSNQETTVTTGTRGWKVSFPVVSLESPASTCKISMHLPSAKPLMEELCVHLSVSNASTNLFKASLLSTYPAPPLM